MYSVITTRVCREIETARTENRTLKGSSSFHQLQAKTTSLGTALSTYITDLLLFGARSESDDPSDNEMDDKSGDDDDKAEDGDDRSVRGGTPFLFSSLAVTTASPTKSLRTPNP